jgi:phospholipid-transporting ATPase
MIGSVFVAFRYITFYNLFFTAIPLIMRATFDQDINYKLTGFVEADGYLIH